MQNFNLQIAFLTFLNDDLISYHIMFYIQILLPILSLLTAFRKEKYDRYLRHIYEKI